MDITQDVPVLSLCTGYAGIELGLRSVLPGCRTLAYVEIETFVAHNLVKKIEAGRLDPVPVFTNLKTFPFGRFRGKVGLLTGGFPCQPFSQVGLRYGTDDPRHLYPYIKGGIVACEPAYVMLENVEGIISSKLKGDHWSDPEGTPVLLHVLRELERIGYEATWGIFSAVEVGAPHQRKRVFIFARRRGAAPLAYCDGTRLEGHSGDEHGADGQIGSAGAGRSTDLGHLPLWPAPPGEQYYWEPPRVVGGGRDADQRRGEAVVDADGVRQLQQDGGEPQGGGRPGDAGKGSEGVSEELETKSEMGRDPDGCSGRMGYAELCESGDNRVDELRLLGNGVVPACAAKAFVTLMRQIEEEYGSNE